MDRREKPYHYLSSADVAKDGDDFTSSFTKKDVAKFLISILCKTEGKDTAENIVARNYQPLVRSGIQSHVELTDFCKDFPQSFTLLGDTDSPKGDSATAIEVQVTSKVKLCNNHMHRPGSCPDDSECGSLHLCKFYVLSGKCSFSTKSKCFCLYGHKLQTDHNKHVLKRHLMNHLKIGELRTLLKRVCNRSQQTRPTLCYYYNSPGGCFKGNSCWSMHLCKQFILSECAYGQRCRMNHNVLHPSIIFILDQYAMDVEDLKEALLDNQREKQFSAHPHLSAVSPSERSRLHSSLPSLGDWGSPAKLPSNPSSSKNISTSKRRDSDDFHSSGSDAASSSREPDSRSEKSKNNSVRSTRHKGKRQGCFSNETGASFLGDEVPLVQTWYTEVSHVGEIAVSPPVKGEDSEEKEGDFEGNFINSSGSLFQQTVVSGCSNNDDIKVSQPAGSTDPILNYQQGLPQDVGKTDEASKDFLFDPEEEDICDPETGSSDSTNKVEISGASNTSQHGLQIQSEPFAGSVSSLTSSLQTIIAGLISNVQKLHSGDPVSTDPESHFVSYLSELAKPENVKAQVNGTPKQGNEKDLHGNDIDVDEKNNNDDNKVTSASDKVESLKYLSEGEITDSDNSIETDNLEPAVHQDRLLFDYNHKSCGEVKNSDINNCPVVRSHTLLSKTKSPSFSNSREAILDVSPDSQDKGTELAGISVDKNRKRSHWEKSVRTECVDDYTRKTGTSRKRYKGEPTKKDEGMDYEAVDSSDDDLELSPNLENHNQSFHGNTGHSKTNQEKHTELKVEGRQIDRNKIQMRSVDKRFDCDVTKDMCDAGVHQSGASSLLVTHVKNIGSEEMKADVQRPKGRSPGSAKSNQRSRGSSPDHCRSGYRSRSVSPSRRKAAGLSQNSTYDSFGKNSRGCSSERQQLYDPFVEFSGSPGHDGSFNQNSMAREPENRRTTLRNNRDCSYDSNYWQSEDQVISGVLPGEYNSDNLKDRSLGCGSSRGDSRSLREKSAEGSTHSHPGFSMWNNLDRQHSPISFRDQPFIQDDYKRMSPDYHAKTKFSSTQKLNRYARVANYEEWKRQQHRGRSRKDNLLSSTSEVKHSAISSHEKFLRQGDLSHDESVRDNVQQYGSISPAYRDELQRQENCSGFGDSGSLETRYLKEHREQMLDRAQHTTPNSHPLDCVSENLRNLKPEIHQAEVPDSLFFDHDQDLPSNNFSFGKWETDERSVPLGDRKRTSPPWDQHSGSTEARKWNRSLNREKSSSRQESCDSQERRCLERDISKGSSEKDSRDGSHRRGERKNRGLSSSEREKDSRDVSHRRGEGKNRGLSSSEREKDSRDVSHRRGEGKNRGLSSSEREKDSRDVSHRRGEGKNRGLSSSEREKDSRDVSHRRGEGKNRGLSSSEREKDSRDVSHRRGEGKNRGLSSSEREKDSRDVSHRRGEGKNRGLSSSEREKDSRDGSHRRGERRDRGHISRERDSRYNASRRGRIHSSAERYAWDTLRRMDHEKDRRPHSSEKDSGNKMHRRSPERNQSQGCPDSLKSGLRLEDKRQSVRDSYQNLDHNPEEDRRRSPRHRGSDYWDMGHERPGSECEGDLYHHLEYPRDLRDRQSYKTGLRIRLVQKNKEQTLCDEERGGPYVDLDEPNLQNSDEMDKQYNHQHSLQFDGSHDNDGLDNFEEDGGDDFDNSAYDDVSNDFEDYSESNLMGSDFGRPGHLDFQENCNDVGDISQTHRKRVSPPDLRNVLRRTRLQRNLIRADEERLQIHVSRGRPRQNFWKGKYKTNSR